MPIHPDKIDAESARIKAVHDLDARSYRSEASFDNIRRILQLSLGTDMVTISLISEDKQTVKVRHKLELKDSSAAAAFCNIAFRKYEPLVIADTHLDARFCDNPLVTDPLHLRSCIEAPLTTADGYNLGTIRAFGTKPKQFTERDADVIRKCAELVMIQLELRRQANRDFLTGVFNRRHFLSGLERELARLRRGEGSAVVAFLDIDHFKRVNDTHGHPTGDRVLREFAGILAGECRDADLVARLGGEEFAVLLADTDLASARIWADRVRRKVAGTRFDGEAALKVTVSIGLAEVGGKLTSPETITEIADRALYDAKRQGRNRVVA